MIDVNIFINSIKARWIKRLTDESNRSIWKQLMNKILQKFGGIVLFKCNMNTSDVKKLRIDNVFLKDIILAWSNLNYEKEPKNLHKQVLWNNTHIKNNDPTNITSEMGK